MNIGGINPSQSVNTRYQLATAQVAVSAAFPGLQSTWAIDPNQPCFRFYACEAGNDTVNGWTTTVSFTLNGSSVGSALTYNWGSGTGIAPIQATAICLFNTIDWFQYYSAFTQGVNAINAPGTGNTSLGFIARYTGLADTLKMVTAPYNTYTPTASLREYMHGFCQSPW